MNGTGPALALRGLAKVFGAAAACEDVSLEVWPGEVLGLVGENGAGKTTVLNLAFGLYRPTRGSVHAFGRPLRPGSPRDAIAAGLGMVHQHFMLVPALTVAENVVLGAEPRRRGLLDRRAAEEAVEAVSSRLSLSLDPRARVADCSVAAQQRVEIARLLHRRARVLLLDEPTALLSPAEAEAFLATARALAREGRAVVLVSHKLREVLAVADRVAVMRRGRLVATRPAAGASAAELADLMVGGRQPSPPGRGHPESRETPEGEGLPSPSRRGDAGSAEAARGEGVPAPGRGRTDSVEARRGEGALVVLRSASARSDRGHLALRGVDLELRAGEILAVAGVDGNGQAELCEVVAGLRPLASGAVERAPGLAGRAALAFLPAERRLALCPGLTVEENLALGRHRDPPFARGPWIDLAGRRRTAERLLARHDVRPAEPLAPAADLSGGNRQKLVVARELDAAPSPPRLVVAVQPTRGLDLAAAAAVHRRLAAARDGGAAVLLASLDLDEVRALGDRIAVMAGGRVVAELPAGAAEGEIGRHMLAGEAPGA